MTTSTYVADCLASELRGNWKKFPSFCWHRDYDLPDAHNWTIVYTHNRDSGLLTMSNADAIAKIMKPHLESDDSLVEDHNHWGVGWVAGYSIRVYKLGTENEYTPAFLAWCDIAASLEDYPVLDEEDYFRRQHEACFENMSYEAGRMVKTSTFSCTSLG